MKQDDMVFTSGEVCKWAVLLDDCTKLLKSSALPTCPAGNLAAVGYSLSIGVAQPLSDLIGWRPIYYSRYSQGIHCRNDCDSRPYEVMKTQPAGTYANTYVPSSETGNIGWGSTWTCFALYLLSNMLWDPATHIDSVGFCGFSHGHVGLLEVI